MTWQCRKCGSEERYPNDGGCKPCTRARGRRRCRSQEYARAQVKKEAYAADIEKLNVLTAAYRDSSGVKVIQDQYLANLQRAKTADLERRAAYKEDMKERQKIYNMRRRKQKTSTKAFARLFAFLDEEAAP